VWKPSLRIGAFALPARGAKLLRQRMTQISLNRCDPS
jgi:hypothetical protein